jgi:hypothetical protein
MLAWTLRENPRDRPNIYEVVKAVSILRGSEIPIRDVSSAGKFVLKFLQIYSSPTATQPITQASSLPSVSPPLISPPTAPISIPTPYQAPTKPTSSLPVEPMRRGRPNKTSTPSPQPVLPAPSSDPFVKLPTSSAAPFEFSPPVSTDPDDDDVVARFPTIEELSGGAFTSSVPNRSKSQPPNPKTAPAAAVEALADDAFALPVQPYRKKQVEALADDVFKSEGRQSRAAAQIRAALEREKDQTEWIEPIQDSRLSSSREEGNDGGEDERVVKPSEVIARGGVYTQPSSLTHSISAPPAVVASPPDGRSFETRRKVEESRRIINESRKILEEQWPDSQKPLAERPQMVSVGVNTSPPPSPPRKPRDLPVPPAMKPIPAPLMNTTESPGFSMQETHVRPSRSKTPIPSPSKPIPISGKEYVVRAESPRPKSRGGYGGELGTSPLGKGLPKQRPQSAYVDNDLEFLRSYDGSRMSPLEKSFTGLSTTSQPASLPSTSSDMQAVTSHPFTSDQDLEFLRMKDEETKASHHHRLPSEHHRREISRSTHQNGRRSSSSGPANPPVTSKHSRQTSFGAISKGIMSSKFGEAFRKFEFSSGSSTSAPHTHDPTPGKPISESRFRAEKTLAKMAPEQVAGEDEEGEDWIVETHELPVKMKQHLSDTRKSSAERDSKAILRPAPVTSMPATAQVPKRARTTNPATSKAKLIEQRMQEYLSAQHREKPPPLTADGYGPYVADARAVRNVVEDEDENGQMRKVPPSVLPKPNILRRPSLKGSVD